MRALTAREMEEVERRAVESQGIRLAALMEAAGEAAAAAARKMAPAGTITIVSGKGNNGGDGLVAARVLAEGGREVDVVLLAAPDTLSPEAAEAFEKLKEKIDSEALRLAVVDSEELLPRLEEALDGATLVVDCIFGFGLKGPARGLGARAIEMVNESGSPVLSVDVPSGVEAATGGVSGPAINATRTITFTAPKIGLLVTPGAARAGRVEIARIGIDAAALENVGSVEVTEASFVRSRLPQRPFEAHKKAVGRVLVVAGSVGMTGAAAMTSESALRAGAGVVTLAVPQSLNDILEVKLTEVMTVPLPETLSRSLLASGADIILELCSSFDALVVGPGLSLDNSTMQLVRALVPKVPIPLVLDADGLNAMVNKVDLLKERKAPLVVTPHHGELARLLGTSVEEVQNGRLRYAKQTASEWGAVVLLKGAGTITSDGRLSYVNPTGNPGLATAGTGDVLSGIVGSFLAQGLDPAGAAVSAAYVHGLAGDLAARALGARCMVATDVISFLHKAFRQLESAGRKVR